jgi:hypothetical protein
VKNPLKSRANWAAAVGLLAAVVGPLAPLVGLPIATAQAVATAAGAAYVYLKAQDWRKRPK